MIKPTTPWSLNASIMSSTTTALMRLSDHHIHAPFYGKLYHFEVHEVKTLIDLMDLPDEVVWPMRACVSSMTAMLAFLRQFVYPNRLTDMSPNFGHSPSYLCLIFNYMLSFIWDKYGHLLDLSNLHYMSSRVSTYAAAVSAHGAPLESCIGFVSPFRPCCAALCGCMRTAGLLLACAPMATS